MTVFGASACADVKLNKEELQVLELRQQLKESIRKQMKKESGSLCNTSQDKKKLPYDNYGSFFGHSQPLIALRVIEESKFVLEATQSAARLMNLTASKADVLVQKVKARELKASRDYSFIFSDDAEHLNSLSATMGTSNQQHPCSGVQGAISNSNIKEDLDERKERYELKKTKMMQEQVQSSKCKVPVERKISLPRLQSIPKKRWSRTKSSLNLAMQK